MVFTALCRKNDLARLFPWTILLSCALLPNALRYDEDQKEAIDDFAEAYDFDGTIAGSAQVRSACNPQAWLEEQKEIRDQELENMSAEWLDLSVHPQQLDAYGTPSPGFFFFTYGPPGSGKETILRKTMDEISLRNFEGTISISQPVEIIVDKMVRRFTGFVEKRTECLSGSNKQQAKDNSQALYWGLRMGVDKGGLGIDSWSDEIQIKALSTSRNLVLETTGRGFDDEWFLTYIHNTVQLQWRYRVIVAYPIVSIQNLIDRAELREARTGQEAAPREQIIDFAVRAAHNMPKLLPYVNEIYLWDNDMGFNEETVIVIYRNDHAHWAQSKGKLEALLESLRDGTKLELTGDTRTKATDKGFKADDLRIIAESQDAVNQVLYDFLTEKVLGGVYTDSAGQKYRQNTLVGTVRSHAKADPMLKTGTAAESHSEPGSALRLG